MNQHPDILKCEECECFSGNFYEHPHSHDNWRILGPGKYLCPTCGKTGRAMDAKREAAIRAAVEEE